MSHETADLDQVIGARARQLRQELNASQAEVAERAQAFGATWTHTAVRDIESGRRSMTLKTVLVLAAALTDLQPGKPPVRVVDLLRSDELVEVTERSVLSPPMLMAMLGEDEAAQGVFFPIHPPTPTTTYPDAVDDYVRSAAGRRHELAKARAGERTAPEFVLDVGPTAPDEDLLSVRSSYGLADHRAARRLGMLDAEVQHRMARLWGEALSARSDRIADERSTGPASAQRRGRVTRELTTELEDDRDLARSLAVVAPEHIEASRALDVGQWRRFAAGLHRQRAVVSGRRTAQLLGVNEVAELLSGEYRGIEGIDWATPELMAQLVEEADRGERE